MHGETVKFTKLLVLMPCVTDSTALFLDTFYSQINGDVWHYIFSLQGRKFNAFVTVLRCLWETLFSIFGRFLLGPAAGYISGNTTLSAFT
jgi:hypothetical protein